MEEEVPELVDLQMAEIRRALQAQQAKEDAITEARFLRHHSPSKPTGSTTTDVSTTHNTPSPRRSFGDGNDSDGDKKFNDHGEHSELNQGGVIFRQADESAERVVYYNEGATELFLSIEECDWERANRVLQAHPEQSSVWVVSTGTVHTTFNWSLWKRLPLHEAARRQNPPELFLTALIRAYPAAIQAVTQFGELPLHMAVECGAPPGVVNLLAIHHWRGCHATDQSGRTPWDIFRESELMLDPPEHEAVKDALQATINAWREIAAERTASEQALHAQHAEGLAAVRLQHDADLEEEQEQQEMLLRQVSVLQQQLQHQVVIVAQQQAEIKQMENGQTFWKERVEELQKENVKWKQAYKREQQTAQELRETVANRDEEAVALADRIVDLQTAITRLARWHQTTVHNQIKTVNQSFTAAMQELSSFTATLVDHEDDLQTLLVNMGVTGEEEDEDEEVDTQATRVTTTTAAVVSPERQPDNVDIQRLRQVDEDGRNETTGFADLSGDLMDEDILMRAAQAAKVSLDVSS